MWEVKYPAIISRTASRPTVSPFTPPYREMTIFPFPPLSLTYLPVRDLPLSTVLIACYRYIPIPYPCSPTIHPIFYNPIANWLSFRPFPFSTVLTISRSTPTTVIFASYRTFSYSILALLPFTPFSTSLSQTDYLPLPFPLSIFLCPIISLPYSPVRDQHSSTITFAYYRTSPYVKLIDIYCRLGREFGARYERLHATSLKQMQYKQRRAGFRVFQHVPFSMHDKLILTPSPPHFPLPLMMTRLGSHLWNV